jgi:hypothetical protein
MMGARLLQELGTETGLEGLLENSGRVATNFLRTEFQHFT